jgi:hypothetical protein
MNFLGAFLWILGGLAASAVFTRMAFAVTERIAKAPCVDLFVSLFT